MSAVLTDIDQLSQSLVQLVQTAVKGVVAVKGAPYRIASGVALREDLVAIADHTLKREGRVPLQTADGTEATATLAGRDRSIDVAILKIEGLKLDPLSTSEPSRWKPGFLAAVVGLTVDAGPSASLGILGAVGGPRKTWRGGTLDHFLRLDVNLYPSQSGAAVVDAEGRLIGLATPGLLRHSGVAVPFSTLNALADELVKQGRVRRGYLGVGLQPVSIPEALQDKIGRKATSGLMVLSIESGSAAEKAGLQLGDILISLGAVLVNEVDELQAALRGDNVGQTLTAELLRGGERLEVPVTIAERATKER